MLGVGGKVGKEGALLHAEVGDARFHDGAVFAAEDDVEITGAAIVVVVVGPLVDIRIVLAGELFAKIDDGLESVAGSEFQLVFVDDEEVFDAGDGVGDNQ